jgi:putative phosphoribosyl transferase
MFRDRKDAGARLAEKLSGYRRLPGVSVLALPRGGVVTAAEIARRIGAPLDVLIVRKIGHPWQPELAVGALAETGAIVYNEEVASSWGVTRDYLRAEAARQRDEIARRQQLYRGGQQLPRLTGSTVILVDDGIATGATVKAAIEALRRDKPREVILAVPVAPRDTAAELERLADRFICLERPGVFLAVGNSYEEFPQVSDDEVVALLGEFRRREAA